MLIPSSTVTFVVPAGDHMYLDSTASFTVTISGTATSYATSAVLGPYETNTSIILASGTAPVFVKFGAKYAQAARIRSLAVVGTSLVNQCEEINTSGKLGASSRSWIDWASIAGGGAFDFVNLQDSTVYTGWEPSGSGSRHFSGLNFGVSGQTSQQIWGRARQIVQHRANFQGIVCDLGTNDMGVLTAAEILFYKVALSEYFIAYGVKAFTLTILARDTSSWSAGGAERDKANLINSNLKEYAERFSDDFILSDWNKYWVDKGSQYGTPRSGFSDDGIHFAPAGAMTVGYGLWNDYFSKYIPEGSQYLIAADDLYDATDNPKGNLYDNPQLRGTGGTAGTGATGDVADDFTLERTSGSAVTVVGSKVTDTDGDIAQRLVFTLTGGSAFEEFYFRASSPTNVTHDQGGNLIRPYCVLRFNNEPDTFAQIGLEVVDQNNTIFRSLNFQEYSELAYKIDSETVGTDKLVILGRPLLFTAGSTTCRFRLLLGMTDGGSTGASIDVFALGFKPVDAIPTFVPDSNLYISYS